MKQNKFINNIQGKPYVKTLKKWGNQINGLKAQKKLPASPLFNFSYIIEGNKKPRFVALKNSAHLLHGHRKRLLLKRKKFKLAQHKSQKRTLTGILQPVF